MRQLLSIILSSSSYSQKYVVVGLILRGPVIYGAEVRAFGVSASSIYITLNSKNTDNPSPLFFNATPILVPVPEVHK